MAQAVISVTQQSGEDYGEGDVVAKSIFYLISQDANQVSKNVAPLVVPLVGDYFSYEMFLRFRCDVAPVTKVFNFKCWTDVALPAGYTLTINNSPVTTYQQPVNAESEQGTRVDFENYTSENTSIQVAGELVNIGDFTDFIVFQLKIEPGSIPISGSINLYFVYDEI